MLLARLHPDGWRYLCGRGSRCFDEKAGPYAALAMLVVNEQGEGGLTTFPNWMEGEDHVWRLSAHGKKQLRDPEGLARQGLRWRRPMGGGARGDCWLQVVQGAPGMRAWGPLRVSPHAPRVPSGVPVVYTDTYSTDLTNPELTPSYDSDRILLECPRCGAVNTIMWPPA